MSQELLYTSAPEGLNPGDQGFCTVVCTQGMPRNLKEFLESLSGYRQADQPPHPVNYSHLMHTVGGKRYQILSRVSDYEMDYSGRTNKLAHHVALTLDELPESGPAALLEAGLGQTRWDGQTRWEPAGPVLPTAEFYQGPARHWEALTGDAGWAGVLAESAADGSHRPMYVIFAPGDEVLPLVIESLAILPREKAWTVSFSTYFTKLPAGVDCLWRFVLDGSPEAQQVRAASHSRKIDLARLRQNGQAAPDDNPFVQAARAGRTIELAAPAASWATMSAPAATLMPAAAETLAQPQPVPTANPFAGPTVAPASPFGKPQTLGTTSSKLPWILGGSAAVLLLGVAVLVYSLLTKDLPPRIAASESDRSKPASAGPGTRRRRRFSVRTGKSPRRLGREASGIGTRRKFSNRPCRNAKHRPSPKNPHRDTSTWGPGIKTFWQRTAVCRCPTENRPSASSKARPWKSPKSTSAIRNRSI